MAGSDARQIGGTSAGAGTARHAATLLRPGTQKVGFALALGLGLALRFAFFGRPGTLDVNTWNHWGVAVQAKGLLDAYNGILFPVQWEILGLVTGVAGDLGTSFAELLKTVNLLFDLGNLILLVVILRRWGMSPAWAGTTGSDRISS